MEQHAVHRETYMNSLQLCESERWLLCAAALQAIPGSAAVRRGEFCGYSEREATISFLVTQIAMKISSDEGKKNTDKKKLTVITNTISPIGINAYG